MAESIASMPGGSVNDPLYLSAVGRADIKTQMSDVMDCVAEVAVSQVELTEERYPQMRIPFGHPVMYLTGEVMSIRPKDEKATLPFGVKSLSFGDSVVVEDNVDGADGDGSTRTGFGGTRPVVRYRYRMTPDEFATMVTRGLGADREFDFPEPNVFINDYTLPMQCQFITVAPAKEGQPPIMFANIIDATCINTDAESADYEPFAMYFNPSPAVSVSADLEEAYRQARETYDKERYAYAALQRSLDMNQPESAQRLKEAQAALDVASQRLKAAETKYRDASASRNRVQPDVTEAERAAAEAFTTTTDDLLSESLFGEDEKAKKAEDAEAEQEASAAGEDTQTEKTAESVVSVQQDDPTQSMSERAERKAADELRDFDVDNFDFFGGNADFFDDLDEDSQKKKSKKAAKLTQMEVAAEELEHADDVVESLFQ